MMSTTLGSFTLGSRQGPPGRQSGDGGAGTERGAGARLSSPGKEEVGAPGQVWAEDRQ